MKQLVVFDRVRDRNQTAFLVAECNLELRICLVQRPTHLSSLNLHVCSRRTRNACDDVLLTASFMGMAGFASRS